MNPIEALTRLVAMADRYLEGDRARRVDLEEGGPELEEMDRKELAVSIVQAMLNTAIPVARYRASVELDEVQPKRKEFQQEMSARYEYTISAINMSGIISGLCGVTYVPTNVRITVWEQHPGKVEMVTGYQGPTKSQQYREFIRGLPELERSTSVQ